MEKSDRVFPDIMTIFNDLIQIVLIDIKYRSRAINYKIYLRFMQKSQPSGNFVLKLRIIS